ncbi:MULTISPECIES: IclR family transcriptional regulator [unclassified Paenibacillus]|uniref:IclR family transcriptional regulator n=1 Tax=unclassified Paenibacillus TaxID=185978 RepID=UPI001AE8A805|nr:MULTISPECIES: IclR family transcriptional regulator [unclassified Paenibacillus]MBP1154544.1 DNA-binding IclR family transcriptional regulator [Paenibacillus sp. PvP091]MBP1170072.1 DNA-binding IclR family transcriptional regulator [Paenibacillus sp. PvR098]MBP2441100.1 DNA-binding IclR family transcriptional regulator [Paenibacillus sp. PvP052]
MEKKYWVPALEKANDVLQTIAEQPSGLKLIELSKHLGIHKSSMFSLLNTMEALEWVVRESDGTYSLGSRLGYIGNAFFKQFSLIDRFRKEASITKHVIKETIQLAKLEGREVLYLAKEEMPSPVRLASEPGIKLPAHATALGKAMLAFQGHSELEELFTTEELEPCLTPHTIKTREELFHQLAQIRTEARAFDLQEAVMGFCCVAAPVYGTGEKVIAAISCSMFQHEWEEKRELAKEEISALAKRLSQNP